MKTLALVLLGLLLGAAGYGWRHGFGTTSTGNEINRALTEATAGSPSLPSVTTQPETRTATPAPSPADATASPATPSADASHGPTTPQATSTSSPSPAPAAANTTDNGFLLPVQGITRADLHDTFSDARSEGRVHDAIDIMAPAGTPVIAIADGSVEKLFDSKRGGLTIYQFEPSGRYAYYYAHLDRYAEGLAEKQAIKRGQVIGYVGSTGNANAEAPHLHFAIFRLGPERRWWEGEALNPYPILHDGRAL